MCRGVKDVAAAHKKTDVPRSAAAADDVHKDGIVASDTDKGNKTTRSATDSGVVQRKPRGKSILNAHNADVVSLFV